MQLRVAQAWMVRVAQHVESVEEALGKACEDCGLPSIAHCGLFPRGWLEVFHIWSMEILEKAARHVVKEDWDQQRVRDRIVMMVLHWILEMEPYKKGVDRVLHILRKKPSSWASWGWALSHRVWCISGDTSVDLNFYSKRMLLMGVMRHSCHVWLKQTPTNEESLAEEMRKATDRVILSFQSMHRAKDFVWQRVSEVYSRVRSHVFTS